MHQTEGTFWRNTVKPQFVKYSIHHKRIESPLTPGFPDTIVLTNRVTSLIEIKSKPIFLPYLGCKPIQRQVMRSWIDNGGNAYLLAQVDETIHFMSGDNIPETKEALIHSNSILSGPRKLFEWAEMKNILQEPLWHD